MVTRSQARKQSVAQGCKDPGDDTELEGYGSSSVPCESTNGDVNSGSNCTSGGRGCQEALALILHLEGSQFQVLQFQLG